MRRILIFVAVLLLAAPSPLLAAFGIFQLASNIGAGWQIMPIGGGGFVTGLAIECDQGVASCNNSGTVTKLARVDVWGAYL